MVTLAYEQGDLTTVTDPLGNVTTRFTDAVGRLVAVTNPRGQRTRYAYDALNQVTAITDALGALTQFSYDGNGNLTSLTDARSHATTYAYNSMDRVTSRTDPLSRSESYGYDNNGNPTAFTDRKSQAQTTTYDRLERPTLVTYADSSTTAYTWDAGNRLTQLVDSLAGTITRSYDDLNRLTQEVTPTGTISYTYDAAGRRATMTVAGQPTVSYTYDNANRLTAVTQGTATVGLTYDNADRRTALTLPNGTSTEYTYDNASRLTGLTYKAGTTTLGTLTYSYDAAGTRTAVGGTWARTGQPAAVSSATYNAANHQLTFGGTTLTYDLNGNLTGDGTTTYTWNARNQLVGISGGTSFVYDAAGRRQSKTIGGTTTAFLHDGLNPVQEQAGSTTTNLLTGLGIDEFYQRADGTTTDTFFTDALGSAVALTDGSGSVAASYTYAAFGATAVTGTTTNPFDYTGRESDGTGLKYYRARYYHPQLQRFLGEDLWDFAGGDVNLFAYVLNVPTQLRDPLGLYVVSGDCDVVRVLAGRRAGAAGCGPVGPMYASVGLPMTPTGMQIDHERFGGRIGPRTGPGQPHIFGQNGPRIMSRTVYSGPEGRIDVENQAPGVRPGNIHFQKGTEKYLYDPATRSFPGAPNRVNELLSNQKFAAGIEKALRFLGER
jgi:RHS repeat-associated protein